MKNLLMVVVFVLTANLSAAQTFNYQAAVRDAGGDLIINQNIGVQVRILAGSTTGQEVFAELWNTDTNLNGVFDLTIGNGLNISGNLALLDWGNVSYFLEIAIDETGGTTYIVIGATELYVVPIAMTSLQFEAQVGTTDVIQLAQTVSQNTGSIANLNGIFVDQTARILTLENQNLDARLTLVETEIAQNTAAIALNTAKETNATHTGDVTGATVLTIAENAVTTTKINNGAVTANKLNAANGHILIGNGTTATEYVITGAASMSPDGILYLEPEAVTSNIIADASIVTADLDVAEISGGTDDLTSDTELTEALAAQALNITGTPSTIPMFTTASTVGNSQLSDNGSTIFVGNGPGTGNLNVAGNLNYTGDFVSTGTGNLFLNSWDVYTDSNVFNLSESGVAPRLSIIPGGNVGISVQNPTQALDVLGNINASGDLYLKGQKIISNDGFGRLEFFDDVGNEHLELNQYFTHFSGAKVLIDQDLILTQKLGLGNGTNDPSATLDVLGTVKIVDGTQGIAKVLTSDASGNATWQDPAAIADGSITETKLAFDTATQTELDLKANSASPIFTGDNVVFLNTGNFNLNNNLGQTFLSSNQIFNDAQDNFFNGVSVEFNNQITNFNSGVLNILNSPQVAGHVLTDVNGDGNATWQAPVMQTIADGSITEAKLAFDTATQTELNLKANLTGASFTGDINAVNINASNNLNATGSVIVSGDVLGTNLQAIGGNVSTNEIVESTANNGVIIDGVTIKDNNIVTSTITIANGAGANKVLTSDASGIATWQAPSTSGAIADGSITEAKLAFDTATQAELNLKADSANPTITGMLTTDNLTVNGTTSINTGNVSFASTVPLVEFSNGQTNFGQVASFNAVANFNTFQTNFNTGDVKFANSSMNSGYVLTDVNGDGIATWQAPTATAAVADGSITETKLSASVNTSLDLADTAVQPAALNTKANLVSPTFTTPNLGVATSTSINGVALTNGGNPTAYLNAAGTYTVPAGASAPTTYVVGTNYPELGGIVIWVSSNGQHGLVAEATDMLTSGVTWYNAQDLTSNPSNHSGAANQFADWRVPTRSQAYIMHSVNATSLYGNYWTSTELNTPPSLEEKAIRMELYNVGPTNQITESPFPKSNADVNMRSVRTF
ncbi:hypothetical protein [uncultured Lacinutrix sp.]|uniref:beta strand repeat-containing protein n=1 Tax=uncultured Lacinutrix sp. TaxID=574032 RepID=UPI002628C14C|nr:hypothetical protein [uncultured Lacinutrix sp.]